MQFSGVLRVAASGGKSEAMTKLDPAQGDICHPWPQLLPGGEAVLFTAANADSRAASHVDVVLLKTGERRRVVQGATHARFISPGYLIYNEGNSLKAAPFDPARLEVTGAAAAIAEAVEPQLYNVSGLDVLAYVPGGEDFEATLLSIDRAGNAQPLAAPPRPYQDLVISPDGTRLALLIGADAPDVWVYHLTRGTLTRLTYDGALSPVWSPDGKRISYVSRRNGTRKLFWKAADGSGAEEEITSGEIIPTSWSPDGKLLAFTQLSPSSRSRDIWLFSTEDRKTRPLLQTPFSETSGQFSPDGRFIAFTSDESGQNEVYVQAFPEGERWQISADGGSYPAWSPDGTELFYIHPAASLMSAAVRAAPHFNAGTPRTRFNGDFFAFTVSATAQQIIIIRETRKEGAPAQINVMLNWLEELRTRLQPTR